MGQTVSRAIEILELCSEQPRQLLQIAEVLGVHRTTALRIIQTLIEAGFIRRNSDGLYGAGFRLAGLARAALDQFDLRNLVHPHIAELSAHLGFTVQFAVPDGNKIIYADKIVPLNSITLNTIIGGSVVLHTAGVAKAILANLPTQHRDKILSNSTFEKFTANTITSRADFDQRLTEVRKAGWASDSGEYESFSNCIAAPVWDHSNRVAGAISLTAFREVADVNVLLDHLSTLLATTIDVSRELGWRPSLSFGKGQLEANGQMGARVTNLDGVA
jgi:DNA-binding IclR family transcriptional regulator